jgi:hypothetical protein
MRLASDERCDDVIQGGIGVGGHLVVCPVLDRVGSEDPGNAGEAERRRLRERCLDEFGRGDEDAGDSAAFDVGDVMHTA